MHWQLTGADKDITPRLKDCPYQGIAEQGPGGEEEGHMSGLVRKGDTGGDKGKCGVRHAPRPGCSHCLRTKLSAELPEMGLIMSKVVLKIGCLGLIHQYFVGIGDRDC